ncbi:MAG: methylmalonyl Co-A mutase-associated GTPase MeaB [Verrucomicrobiota bacterium]
MSTDSPNPAAPTFPDPARSAAASLPDWVPPGSELDPKFACRVMAGVAPNSPPPIQPPPAKRPKLSLDEYTQGVLAADIGILSRAITLVESNHPTHQALAQQLLTRLLPHTGNSTRVGITGVPGAGKSTLIETLGCLLCDQGHRLAVLAVDPSSSVTGGSILGDKTRMENLVRNPHAYIRPSPSGGSLGGVARKSRETMLLCEAAGFDVILVETVGVGQNEITVRSMVDCFLLIMLAGAGDELQGMKKGVIEIADLLAVNKADGDNVQRANLAAAESNRVLSFLQPATAGWKTRCTTCSALVPATLTELWGTIDKFVLATRASGAFAARRERQAVEWMHAMIEEELRQRFFRNPRIQLLLPDLERQVASHQIPAATAAQQLLRCLP